ncbi:MAG: DUF262 domain-containing protein [Chryseobacterium sp.]|uniref:DUF262 domain-containing protein n=1 Tax=Chryseobacterium TaxID=59732 RepID=UPI00054ED68E|nr:DUF262 domain-containing protein [Chryseobacterium jejuense]MBP2619106.1 uncharacterized protein with ParB-like and HNH nuclease domain [Chryseobacterium jejuense]
MSFQIPITISEAIDKIENNQFLLPAIQREFIWTHSKIEWLFDSIMRNYPISSFLFWKVEEKTAQGYRFYKFINEYRERYKTHNEEISTNGISAFNAVLDGQQRLTSLYIGLKGSYAYKEYRRKWEDTEWSIPTRHLYLNISKELEDEEDGRIYEFQFLEKEETSEAMIYSTETDQWFKVGCILNYTQDEVFDNFVEELENSFSRKALRQLRRTIVEKPIINYFLEGDQRLDKALNIFIRINSGGEPLNFSDLLMSIAVANWTQKDARKEIHKLVDIIRDKGFSISKDLILKSFLYLHSKDIKFNVTNFSKENAKDFEAEWERIRDSILSAFDLVKTFGFTDYTLTSKNAIIPIIYYLYHKNIYRDFSTKIEYKDDREKIKKWLHIVLIKRLFGGTSDSVLSQIRKTFTENINELKIKPEIFTFPSESIFKYIRKDLSIGDEFIEEILLTQMDNQYAFSILSLLYPDLDYKNNNFHKDHIHPIFQFKDLSDSDKEKFDWHTYNSIYNLQMLDANENMSKSNKTLEEWIVKETHMGNRSQFLKSHLIPDIDLSLVNFSNYYERRKELLMIKLRNILN